jgi:two-component system OmpR family sensor kinase
MRSLRARVLASVLLLAAVGLVLLAAVTYAEQRSFLQGRVDQEVRGAGATVSQVLDRLGLRPPGSAASSAPDKRQGRGRGPGPGGGGLTLPPGTYGQRRDASGKVLGHELFTYGQAAPPAPKIPARVPVGKLFTVGSVGSSGLRYRAYMSHDPEDTGLTLVAVPLGEVQQNLSRLLLVEGLVIGGVLLALGLSAFFLVRLGLRPLDRIEQTAGKIAGGDLSRRVSPADTRSEVGRLGVALNAMLDRLESAFTARTRSEERLRQFLADASHELRTPLASIRGYAELHRIGATGDAAGTEMAMRRIEEESKRMGVLVVDLAALARDAAQDARATAPDRAISVNGAGSATVSGDPHQLHQVIANLTRNALVHTPPGSPIELSIARNGKEVSLSVRDHGPGLPGGSGEHIFDRFWRAEGGRERGRAGAGLGLAIVRGVLDAHGGRITAENAPGGGAVFVVRLPSTGAEGPAHPSG